MDRSLTPGERLRPAIRPEESQEQLEGPPIVLLHPGALRRGHLAFVDVNQPAKRVLGLLVPPLAPELRRDLLRSELREGKKVMSRETVGEEFTECTRSPHDRVMARVWQVRVERSAADEDPGL